MSENRSIEIKGSNLQSPVVTIAIPTYRRAAYLKEAVDSAIKQENFENYEVLICDNNPERGDETETLMSTYTDDRISYFKNSENLGMVGNWNRLYELAKGEWVVMLHDDDLIAPFFLEYIFNERHIFEKGDLIFPAFTGKRSLFMKSGRESDRKITYPKIIDLIQFNLIGPPVGMIMRKPVCEELGGFSTMFYPSLDYHFYVEALLKKKRIVKLLGEPMAFYRVEVNESLRPETQVGFVRNIYQIGQYIESKSPVMYRPFIRLYSRVSSYYAAKGKQNEYPDNDILYDIETRTNPGAFRKILAKILFRVMRIRRCSRYPGFHHQYDKDLPKEDGLDA